jgi:hypothetical protein
MEASTKISKEGLEARQCVAGLESPGASPERTMHEAAAIVETR